MTIIYSTPFYFLNSMIKLIEMRVAKLTCVKGPNLVKACHSGSQAYANKAWLGSGAQVTFRPTSLPTITLAMLD
jgi:hypothetical protein